MFDFNIDVQQQATAVSYFTFYLFVFILCVKIQALDETYSYSL